MYNFKANVLKLPQLSFSSFLTQFDLTEYLAFAWLTRWWLCRTGVREIAVKKPQRRERKQFLCLRIKDSDGWDSVVPGIREKVSYFLPFSLFRSLVHHP